MLSARSSPIPAALPEARDLPPLGVDPPPPGITAARARALSAFIALAAGLSTARAWPGPPANFWFASAIVLLLAGVAVPLGRTRSRAAGAALLAAMFGLGAGVQRLHADPPRADALDVLLAGTAAPAGPRPARLRGVLLEDPRPVMRAPARPVAGLAGFMPAIPADTARLRAESVELETGWTSATGLIHLRLQHPPGSGAVALRAGDRLRLTGLYTPTPAPTNPGQPDPRLRARARGLVGSLTIADPRLITILSHAGPGPPPAESFSPEGPAAVAGPFLTFSSGGPGQKPGTLVSGPASPSDHGPLDRWRRTLLRLRADLKRRAVATLGEEPGPAAPARPGRTLLADLLLGLDNPADPALAQAFTRLGLAHVLAISGFHLVILAAVSLALIRLSGDHGRLEPLIVAIAVLLYLAVVPASAPVLRSGVMVLALLAAEVLGRRYDRLTILAWTAIALLLLQPADLGSLGFQLSYGLTGLLLWLGPRFHAALFGIRLRGALDRGPRRPGARMLEAAKRLCSTSLLCWAVAAPTIAWHTGLFSPLAVLSTVIITPLIVALLWAGFTGLLLGAIWPGLAAGLAPLLLDAGDFTAAVVHRLDDLPGASLRVPAFSLGLAVAATGVLLHWARFAHRRDPIAWVLTALVALWGAVELARPFHTPQALGAGVVVRVDALEAGRGSCAIVRTPRRAILWDCGSSRPGFGRLDLPRAARAMGARRITTAIISHADLMHFSAIVEAAESLGLREVLVTPALPDRARQEPQGPAATALRLLKERGVEVRVVAAGDELDLGPARLRFLSPPSGAPWAGDDLRSLIAAVEPAGEPIGPGSSLLLTGQLADDAVDALIAADALPRGAVVFLAARGSARALRELLLAVDPRAILASNSEPIQFAEVWAGVAPVLQTSEHGALRAEIDRDGAVRPGPARRP